MFIVPDSGSGGGNTIVFIIAGYTDGAVFGSVGHSVQFLVFEVGGQIRFFREEHAEVEVGEVGEWFEGL